MNQPDADESADNHADEYLKAFGNIHTSYPKDSRLAKAYETALDIRKFEINLYWQRSNSFWLVVGGIAAALGVLLSGKVDDALTDMGGTGAKEVICCCLSLAGATIAYAWSLVNKGSKFWQRNWEYQVDILESAVLGPLYRSVFAAPGTRAMYSVSKINIWISRYICLIFSLATLAFALGQHGTTLLFDAITYLIHATPIGRIWPHADVYVVFKLAVVAFNVVAIIVVRYNVTEYREQKKAGKAMKEGDSVKRRVWLRDFCTWSVSLIAKLTDRRKEKRPTDFDVAAEASIRAIRVTEKYGSEDGKKGWGEYRDVRVSTRKPLRRSNYR